MLMQQNNPDDVLLVVFKDDTVPNPAKSSHAGRPIVDDREICLIRLPGSIDIKPFPANAHSDWVIDPLTGEQRSRTYAERFPRQYAQFKNHMQQTRTGTPLTMAPFVTPAQMSNLNGLAIFTVEALAHVDGQELKNLGPGGRDLKNRAQEYLENARNGVAARQAMDENEALKAQMQVMQTDLEKLRSMMPQRAAVDEQFQAMSTEQLCEFVEAQTGHRPHGALPRNTLELMAMSVRSQPADL